MRGLPLVVVLMGCQPGAVMVGERTFTSVEGAALYAQTGDTLTFTDDLVLDAGVTLAPGVTIQGPVTLRADGVPALTSSGLTTLRDVRVEGTGAQGTLVDVGELVMEDSEVTRPTVADAAAIRVAGPVTIHGSALRVAGDVLFARQPTGRPPAIEVEDSELAGSLALEADTVTLTGLTGTFGVDVDSPRATLTDVDVQRLDTRGGPVQLVGITSTGPVGIANTSATMLDVAGGTWFVQADRLDGADIDVAALAGSVGELHLDTVRAPLLQFDGADTIELNHATADYLRLEADAQVTTDINAHQAEFLGPGSHQRLTLTGAAPQLTAVSSTFTSVFAQSSSEAVVFQLEGVNMAGLLVMEPPGAARPYLVDTTTFVSLRNVTLLGGTRSKTTPRFSQLFVYDSLFEMRDFGAVEIDTHFINTLAFGLDKVLVPRNGLVVERPDFTEPGLPTVDPASEHAALGAFAGPTGPEMLELWAAR